MALGQPLDQLGEDTHVFASSYCKVNLLKRNMLNGDANVDCSSMESTWHLLMAYTGIYIYMHTYIYIYIYAYIYICIYI